MPVQGAPKSIRKSKHATNGTNRKKTSATCGLKPLAAQIMLGGAQATQGSGHFFC